MRTARSTTRSFAAGNLAVRGIFAAGLLCLVAGAGLWVAQPVTAVASTDDGIATVDDIQLTVEARRFLNQDAHLLPLNLGVLVKGRVATLSGAVPSAEEKRRAEERLRQLTGLVKVVNELSVERPEDRAVNSFTPLPTARTARAEEHATRERNRDVLTVHTSSPPRTAGSSAADPSIERLPVIRLSVPTIQQPAVSTAKPVLPFAEDRQARLVQNVERVRTADARFHGLQVEVSDGILTLRGKVARGEDQIDFANQVSRLDGVVKVVIAGVQVR